MASLKNIMNVEEDHVDSRQIKDEKESAPRPTSGPEFLSSSSRYATQVSQSSPTPSYSLDQRRSSSSHALHSFAANTPSSSSPGPASSDSTSRRRSNTSTEDMNSYSSSHGLSAMSPGHLTPFTTGSGGDSVKYTPITGRVSRAKKGVPVHTCGDCVPPKTFTRAEHLRRHQLSHGPAALPCTVLGCGKSFHRKDLLERHLQKHDQGSPPYGMSSPSSGADISSPVFAGLSPKSNSADRSPWTAENSSSRHDAGGYPHSRSASHDFNSGFMPDHMSYSTPSSGIDSAYSRPRTTGLHSLLPPGPYLPIHDGASDSSTSSTSQHLPAHTSSSEWHPSYSVSPMPNSAYSLEVPYHASSPQMFPPFSNEGLGISIGYDSSIYSSHNPNTTVRSLSPSMAVVQSSETLVTSPSAPPSGRVIDPPACSRQTAEALGLLTAADEMPVSLSRATCTAIPAYLDVYWDRVHSCHPIIHKPTFEDASEVAPEHKNMLLCAMAAVATQFLPAKQHRIHGHQLHAYAWDRCKMLTNTDDWSLTIMQTVLLCEYYARFRGRRKEAHEPSFLFSALYQLVTSVQNTAAPVPASRDTSLKWKMWVDVETKRRLLAACFLLDVHSMFFHEQPGVSITGLSYAAPSTLPIPLTESTMELWDAPNGHAWDSSLRTKRMLSTVSNVNITALTPLDIASAPQFDASILLAAHALRLPRRQGIHKVDLTQDVSIFNTKEMHIVNLFENSAVANTYLALHYTPLRTLLSVSGDSWVFNKKVLEPMSFGEHQAQLLQWRNSGTAAIATLFAARALAAFFALESLPDSERVGGLTCNHISDYWGVYVCALICWAFSHDGEGGGTRCEAVRWIRIAACMEPKEVQNGPRWEAKGIVSLARDVLARDCLGGRSILLADAVGVLRKLDEGSSWKWF